MISGFFFFGEIIRDRTINYAAADQKWQPQSFTASV